MYTKARHMKACLLCLVLLTCPVHTLAAQATVFRCTVDGVVTFSDRPCGEDASVYEGNRANLASSSVADAAQAKTQMSATPSGAAQTGRPRVRADSSIALEQAKDLPVLGIEIMSATHFPLHTSGTPDPWLLVLAAT